MTQWPNTPREKVRAARIAAMNGPFVEWLRWHATPLVQAELTRWTDEHHPTLGDAVFQFTGADGLAVYERGIVSADGTITIAFDDIIERIDLSLNEVAQANRIPLGNVSLRLRSETGETELLLPFVHYSNFLPVLSEHARRLRLRNTPVL